MRRSALAAGLLVLVGCAPGAVDVSGLPVLSETGVQVVGTEVRFQANVDSESAPLQVTVDWGDGATEVLSDVAPGAISVRHVYGSAGDYTIVVEAATPEGGTRVTTVEVTIGEAATASSTSTSPTTTTEATTTTTQATTTSTTTEATTTTTETTTTTTTGTVSGGDLLYYRHRANPTGERQFDVSRIKIGAAWDQFKTVTGGESGVLYAITEEGDLLYYRHQEEPTGERQFEVAGVKIGAGWDQFKTVIAGGSGVLYAITEGGDLLYYRHRANPTGERQFDVSRVKIGAGWDQFKTVIGGGMACGPLALGGPGVLYAIIEGGDLLYYRHGVNPTGERQFDVSRVKIGAGWDQFRTVTSGAQADGDRGTLYAVTEP